MEWLGDLVNSPWADKGLAIVLVFVLLRFLREDMGRLREAIDALTAKLGEVNTTNGQVHQAMVSQAAHQTSRMEEIRRALFEIARLLGSKNPKGDR